MANYYQSGFYVPGEDDQGDIRKFLAVQEEKNTKVKFFRALANWQRDDPNHVYLNSVKIEDRDYAVIITEHAFQRARERTILSRRELESRCMEILSMPFVTSSAIEYPLRLADDGITVCTENPSRDGSITVVDKKTRTIYIFEVGFQYIRLVTVWGITRNVFHVKPGTVAIKVCIDDSLVFDLKDIPEIKFIQE